ncbi:29881_t:CDS:2 [Gigaspora margarita]|uniref:29881_t:CDS:1 n=1 Tax=Gigaspora margarita TaxID=4874 RepID=A0ABM8W5P5_GIGMA|nr:29881_t:CDS:2 [Gigaspora margarita]
MHFKTKQEKVLGTLPKGALKSLTKIPKIKSNLWQGVQNKQQSNPESTLLGLKDLEFLKIELIQKQYFENKLNSSFFDTTPDKPEEPSIGAAWIQVDENEIQVIKQDICRIRNWPSLTRLELLAILMALYTVLEKEIAKIFADSESAIAGIQASESQSIDPVEELDSSIRKMLQKLSKNSQ